MDALKFQDEIETGLSNRIIGLREINSNRPNSLTDSLSPLLLTLRLSATLADCDRDTLDRIPPDNSLAFLIRGDQFLHPFNTPLFPTSVIESSLAEHREAIFSHRFTRSSSSDREYMIHTAIINPGESTPIVVGFFGPAHTLEKIEHASRFCDLADRSRTVYRSLTPLVNELKAKMNEDGPTMVINRGSGRLIAANETALTQTGIEQQELIGMEFGQVQKALLPLPAGTRLTMSNQNQAGLNLAVIDIAPNSETEQQSGEAHTQIERIRKGLNDIFKTALNMDSKLSNIGDLSRTRNLMVTMARTEQAIAELARITDNNSKVAAEVK